MDEDTQTTDQQPQTAEQQRRRGIASALDREAVMHAQAQARAQAQAAATVTIATIVSLVTSAFAFVAAFAWNNVVQELFSEKTFGTLFGFKLDPAVRDIIYAVFVTMVAVVVIVTLSRVARRLAVQSAIHNG